MSSKNGHSENHSLDNNSLVFLEDSKVAGVLCF